MNIEQTVVTTPQGFAEVIDFGDDRWGFAIYRYAKGFTTLTVDGGELVAKGFADTEEHAHICASALAYHLIHDAKDNTAERERADN